MYPRSVFVCMKFFSQYFVYTIHRLIDIIDMCVPCDVGIEFLYVI
jgi:hypothetical protein